MIHPSGSLAANDVSVQCVSRGHDTTLKIYRLLVPRQKAKVARQARNATGFYDLLPFTFLKDCEIMNHRSLEDFSELLSKMRSSFGNGRLRAMAHFTEIYRKSWKFLKRALV